MSLISSVRQKFKQKLRHRGIYAIVAGPRIGDFYLSHESDPELDKHTFIQLPDFRTVVLSTSTVNLGLSSGVMDFVRVIPQNVYEVVVREWKGRPNDITIGRPEPIASDTLGSAEEQPS